MGETLSPFAEYIYPEYVVAVIMVTAVIRWAFRGIDYSIHPKWVALIVGVVLGVAGFAFKTLREEEFHFFKVLISFSLSVVGYDYFWKVVKDIILRNQANNSNRNS